MHVTGKRSSSAHCMLLLARVRRSLGEGENLVAVYWLVPLVTDGSLPC